MRILVDSDSMPAQQRRIIARAAERARCSGIFVANRPIPLPEGEGIEMVVADDADDWLAEHANGTDLVITRDIPLASRVISRGADVITDRGEELDDQNIELRLAERDMAVHFRDAGLFDAKASPYSERERREFANALDRYVSRNRA